MCSFSDEGLLNRKDSIHIHVENLKSPRGYFLFSTWARIISSEVFFLLHVEDILCPRGES